MRLREKVHYFYRAHPELSFHAMSSQTAAPLDRMSFGGDAGPKGLVTRRPAKDVPMTSQSQSVSRVLLVEDSPFLRYAFSRFLRLQGYEVMEAANGRAALDCFPDFQAHLVITDLMMPVMDGVALIEALREDPATAEIPVLAITADSSLATERRARAAGAVDVIMRPIDLPDLLVRIRAFAN
jgi:CheY-like chemotaxis protein